MYPKVNCDLYYENYKDDLYPFAFSDYVVNNELMTKGKAPSFQGYMQCFCDQQSDNEVAADTLYASPNDASIELPICYDYSISIFVTLAIGQGITGFIVVVNIILKTLTIKLITWIGFDTHSEQLTKITNGVFIA